MSIRRVNFVGQDNAAIRTATTATYETNVAGDTLVVVMAARSIGGIVGPPESQVFDSAGNTYDLVYFAAEDIVGGKPAIAMYVNSNCVANIAPNVVDIDSIFTPVDVTFSIIFGFEFQCGFSTLTFDNASVVNGTGPLAFDIITPIHGSETLVIGFAMSDNGITTLDMQASGGNLTGFAGNITAGWEEFNASISVNYPNQISPVDRMTTTTTGVSSVFVVALTGANNVGGSGQKYAVVQMIKGPIPTPPREGRAMAMTQIDCTQFVMQPLPIEFPELVLLEGFGIKGATVVDLDLEHITQGSGLSEVRSVIVYSRPAYAFDGSGSNPSDVSFSDDRTIYGAILTNTTSLISYVVGGGDALAAQNQIFIGTQVFPFPASKNSLKFRFIVPQGSDTNQIGKYTLVFCNFEIPTIDAATAQLVHFGSVG